MSDEDEVVYAIDAEDRLVSFSRAWDEAAAENGAPELASSALISRSLWDFIADDTTRHLYAEILKRVRTGHRVSFMLRCDSPDWRHRLELTAQRTDGLNVEFRVRTLALERRPAQVLLELGRPRTESFLRICSWCKRIPHESRWIEIEEAAEQLRIFESAGLPQLSHGICEDCERRITDQFLDSDAPPSPA